MKLFRTIKPLLIAILCVGMVLPSAVSCDVSGTDPKPETSSTEPSDTGEDTKPVTDYTTESDTQPETDPEIVTETEEITDSETQPVEEPAITVQALAEALRSSRYQWENPLKVDLCGLSDPAAVGIDKAAFEKVLYSVGDDAAYQTVVIVTDYGITQDAKDNSPAFNDMMTALSDTAGKVKIVFPAGTYRFSSTLRIAGCSGFTFCSDTPGTPFEILMTEWTPGIRISDSTDIQINDMAFDYTIPSAIAGTIVSGSENSVVIRVNDTFDLSDAHYNGGNINWGSYMEMVRDDLTGEYYPDINGNLLYNSTGDGIRNIKAGSWNADTHELTLEFLNRIVCPDKGTTVCVAYTMYENFGIYAENSENLRLESVRLYHTMGMAIGMISCKDVFLNRVFLSPREGTDMLMTATADGLHCISCTGEIMVTNSVFEKSHDDCMNINSRFLSVVNAGEGAIQLEGMVVPVHIGDELDVYSKNNLQYIGTIKVCRIDGNTVYGDGIVAEMQNAFACNITTNPTLTIRNCFFGNKRNRGLLIQVRNVLIENCTFQNIVHDTLQILSVPSSFGEGIVPRNVTVRNNKFITCNQSHINLFSWAPSGGKSAGTIRDVYVTNNYFYNSISPSIQISTGGDLNIHNNLFDTIGSVQANNRYNIWVSVSEDVVIRDNLGVNMTNRYNMVNEREISRDKECKNVVVENNKALD